MESENLIETYSIGKLLESLVNIIPIGKEIEYLEKIIKYDYDFNLGDLHIVNWGVYTECTLESDLWAKETCLDELLSDIDFSMEKEFYDDFKEGKYILNPFSSIYAEKYGDVSRSIIGVEDGDNFITIKTMLNVE